MPAAGGTPRSWLTYWSVGHLACAAGMIEAGGQFRRVNRHLHLRKLRAALDRCITDLTAECHDKNVRAA